MRNDLQAINNSRTRLANDIARARTQTDNQLALKRQLDDQIELIELEIEITEQLIAAYDLEMELKRQELYEKEADYERQYEAFLNFLKISYEYGTASYLEILFGSRSFGDFLTRLDIIGWLIEYDRGRFRQLRNTKAGLENWRDALEEVVDVQAEYRERLAARTLEFEEKATEAQDMILRLESERATFEALLVEADRARTATNETIARAQRELEARQAAMRQHDGAEMLWPVDPQQHTHSRGVSWTAVSSDFGNRPHPILNRQEFHTGIDIPARNGSPVFASADGIVTVSTFCRGYGNYVVIYHGSGVSTLYSHNSRNLVAVGDEVKRGDRIANIGTTGLSTGFHLHFEVRVNNQWVDPLPYLGLRR
jgi:murein DD-endopeptidase MepM/ murein hydrolase activator NlpD